MEKPIPSKEPTSLSNEIPNYELILNTVKQEENLSYEYDNITFKNISAFEKNKILIKIYNELIWRAEISIPKITDLEDLFIIIEYLFKRPFFSGYIYKNNDEENIIDFNIISRIKQIYQFLSETILDLLLIKSDNKDKNDLNNAINNQDTDTNLQKENNNIKKLSDILQLNNEFFKYFCVTINNKYQNKFCDLIQKFEFLFKDIFISDIGNVKIFINNIIKPLIIKYEYCKNLYQENKKKHYIERSEYKEDLIFNKKIIESIEKKFICIYDLFKSSDNSNIQILIQHIKKEFIDKYITFYKENEIEDIEFNESDDYIEEGKINSNKNRSKNKNRGNSNRNIINETYNDNDSSNLDNSCVLEDEATYTVLNDKNKKFKQNKITNNNNKTKEKKDVNENKNESMNDYFNKIKKPNEEKKYLLRNKSNINESDKEMEKIIEKNSRKKKKPEENKDNKNKILKDKKDIKDKNDNINKSGSPKINLVETNLEDFGNIEIRIDQEEQKLFFKDKEKEKEMKKNEQGNKNKNEIKKPDKIKKEKEKSNSLVQSKPKNNSDLNNKKSINTNINIKKIKISKVNNKHKIQNEDEEKSEKLDEDEKYINKNKINGDNNSKKNKFILGKKFNLDDIDLNNMKKVNNSHTNKAQIKINFDNTEKLIHTTSHNKNVLNSEFLNKKRKISSKNSIHIRDELKKLDLRNLI